MLLLCGKTIFLLFLSLELNCSTSAAKEKFLWNFDEKVDSYKKVGEANFKQPGPRPPEFPDLSKNNQSIRLGGNGSRIVIQDPGEDSHYDFTNGDEISITAWVKLEKFSTHPSYIIGKGRTHNPGFGKYHYDGDRPVPITHNGNPVKQLFPKVSQKLTDFNLGYICCVLCLNET